MIDDELAASLRRLLDLIALDPVDLGEQRVERHFSMSSLQISAAWLRVYGPMAWTLAPLRRSLWYILAHQIPTWLSTALYSQCL